MRPVGFVLSKDVSALMSTKQKKSDGQELPSDVKEKINLSLPSWIKEKLEEVARSEGLSPSHWVSRQVALAPVNGKR